jgi:hypothetical protein
MVENFQTKRENKIEKRKKQKRQTEKLKEPVKKIIKTG